MRAPLKPGGAVHEVRPYRMSKWRRAKLEEALDKVPKAEMRAAVAEQLVSFVNQQRYIARSQSEADMRAQLEAVVAAGEALARAADDFKAAVAALGADAEGRYYARLSDGGDVARELTLQAVRRLAEPAREALERLPTAEPRLERGRPGYPLLAALVLAFRDLFAQAGGKVTERNSGPYVEFLTAIAKVLPRDLRRLLPAELGNRIKGILERAAGSAREAN